MLNKREPLLVIILLVSITSFSFFVVLQAQTTKKEDVPTQMSKQIEDTLNDLKDEYPKVEYSTDSKTDEREKIKSSKYNKMNSLNPTVSGNNLQVSFLDWASGLTPLPVEKSDFIIVGNVIEAQAYLSEDKTSVYSEFKVEISDVLKNDNKQNYEQGKNVNIERAGGLVRFPSGFQTLYLVAGQRMPKVKRSYVFFLTHKFPLLGDFNQDFYLLTAYELKEGKVFPLDNPGEGTHPIATFYKDKGEELLLNNLRDAIKKSKTTLLK